MDQAEDDILQFVYTRLLAYHRLRDSWRFDGVPPLKARMARALLDLLDAVRESRSRYRGQLLVVLVDYES